MSEDRKLLRHNFYVFAVSGRLYGIDIGHIREVKEIACPDEITPLPHAQSAVLGYINVRGAIHQVLSLRALFGEQPAQPEAGGMIIYFKDASAPASGIYSQLPGEMLQVSEKEIDRWEGRRPEAGQTEIASWGDYMSCGACRTPRGVVTMLDPRRIFQAAGSPIRLTPATAGA